MIFASPDYNSVKNYAYVLRASCLKNNISFKILLGIIMCLDKLVYTCMSCRSNNG